MQQIQGAMSLNQVAHTCGVNWATVKRWVTDGARGRQLHCFRLGGRIFVTKEALATFMDPSPFKSERDDTRNLKHQISLAQLKALGVYQELAATKPNSTEPPTGGKES